MEKKVTVNLGVQLDPSDMAKFVQVANRYSSTIYIEMEDNRRVNAKSIMGMMNFMTEDGQEVTVRTEGADEAEAAEAIAACLNGKE